MKSAVKILLALLLLPLISQAQCTNGATSCAQAVPHVVKFSGVLKNNAGVARTGAVPIRFVIYSDETSATPLWQEVQNVQVDPQGRFEVMLGAASVEGIPDLFSAGEPRWVGLQPVLPGQEEQPRVQLVSVPYALQAENAQTLGGLPASAFAKAAPTVTVGSVIPQAISPSMIVGNSEADPEIVFRTNPRSPTLPSNANVVNTPNSIPKFYTNPSLVNSQITDENGVVSMQNLSNILFAERFTGGVPDAVAACPPSGCIIYAVSPSVNLNLGTIDPGFKAITIYLGPYTYTVKQITLRKALKIIGMGASGGHNGSTTCSVTAPCNGTTLQSVNGNNPVFVLPQTNNSPETNVLLSGFRLSGSTGNTSEDGFFLDTSTTINSGLWYSTVNDVYLENFGGIGIHIKGRASDFAATTQWVLFNNVVVFRSPGGGNALRLEGATFELRFRNCEFDGQGVGDGTNIFLGGRPGGAATNAFPISIVFEGLVSQQAALAVQIDGGTDISFYGSHHELLSAAYQVTANSGVYTQGLTIADCYFAGNVGVNGGAGYLLTIATTLAQGIYFTHNRIVGSPDIIVKGTNLATVVYQDNLYCDVQACSGPPTSGITAQIQPATAINIGGGHSIALNPSTTPITTIQSSLGPGEMVTLYTTGGPVTFASGGNINLIGPSALTINGSITLTRADLGGSQWIPVAQWNPPPSQ